MGCHDGASASDAGGGVHAKQMRQGEGGADHPIGIPMRATSRTKDGDFKIANAASLDHRIRLFSGAVGCGSCHSVYSKEPKLLVMSNRGSALCLQCHKQ
jgi:predicted CXXCH cytochrome family protein